MISLRHFFVLAILASTCLLAAEETQEGRLLLFPDIHKDKIAFRVWRRLMAGIECGWNRAADYFASGTRVVSEIFAGREMAGIHWPV